MYKIPLDVLQGLLNSLEKSNVALKELAERDDSPWVQGVIISNEKQIQILKFNYSINGN
jgi:hypothetical protein